MTVFRPAIAEEIPKGRLNRRRFLIVPIEAQDQRAPVLRIGGDPDVLDGAGSFDLRQGRDAVGIQLDARGHFPALAQILRGRQREAIGGHTAPALIASEVLCAYRARLRPRQARDIAHIHVQTVEVFHFFTSSFWGRLRGALWLRNRRLRFIADRLEAERLTLWRYLHHRRNGPLTDVLSILAAPGKLACAAPETL